MTLKNIELIGFKSFGKKSVVSFTTPITAVVGPNGSGKSNIVEAIRFVLGEQSMKSLRGKGGVDLIFKGSKSLSSSSRALVSIVFDNSQKIFSFTSDSENEKISLDYDEIIISREVFADGSNRYAINNSEVRLKDIVNLLTSVNIGSSGYHIISQGEADRVLNASNKDRKAMIEDALGLRVYQYRIKEALRKLEKTNINIKEVQSLRKEIAPHLNFLKKQVQVVEKAREMRIELDNLYKNYLSDEALYIRTEEKRLNHLHRTLDERNLSLDERIELLNRNKQENQKENEFTQKIKTIEADLFSVRGRKDEVTRKLGRIEGIIEGLERQFRDRPEKEEKIITEAEWRNFIAEMKEKISQAIAQEDLASVISILRKIEYLIDEFVPGEDVSSKQLDINDSLEYQELQKSKQEILNIINSIGQEENILREKISELEQKKNESEIEFRNSERVYFELLREKNEVSSDLHSLRFEEEKLSLIKNNFEVEINEAEVLVGQQILTYVDGQSEKLVDRNEQEILRKRIEKIKIRLEDTASGNAGDIMKEYQETEDRDKFLAKEVEDLNQSLADCQSLIEELKETLDTEFKNGVEKINEQFKNFFALMFGGGTASLSITMEYKKPKKDEDVEEEEVGEREEIENSELDFERGIEINVSLPHKKVKELNMLSGGERSLTSIALLFAISQVNPPPFLVLDETDAALDEANSRKYGDMLENLSKYSQLVVVTHNRETMSRAQVLYGVTMSADGVSKLLSIHLEDATTYAK